MPSKNKNMKPLLGCIQRKLGSRPGKDNTLYLIVCTAVPKNIRSSIVFVRLKNNQLHVTASTGGAANLLRYCRRAVLEACAVLPEPPESMYIKVAPEGTFRQAPEPTLRTSSRQKPTMGAEAASGLQQAADNIEDKRLSDALKRLASHAQKRPN